MNKSFLGSKFGFVMISVLGLATLVWADAALKCPIKVQVSEDDHFTPGKTKTVSATSAPVAGTKTETLTVKLWNPSFMSYSNLTVQYYIFARDVKTKAVSCVKTGECLVSLPASGKQSVTTDVAKVEFTPAKSVQNGTSSAAPSQAQIQQAMTSGRMPTMTSIPSYQTIPASGKEFHGYAVQLFKADSESKTNVLVGQWVEPIDYTNRLNGATPPDDTPKKHKK